MYLLYSLNRWIQFQEHNSLPSLNFLLTTAHFRGSIVFVTLQNERPRCVRSGPRLWAWGVVTSLMVPYWIWQKHMCPAHISLTRVFQCLEYANQVTAQALTPCLISVLTILSSIFAAGRLRNLQYWFCCLTCVQVWRYVACITGEHIVSFLNHWTL